MFLKRVEIEGDKRPYYDVFLDKGWENWTRVRKNYWGVQRVAGNHLPRDAIRDLNEHFGITNK